MDNKDIHFLLVSYVLGIGGTVWSLSKLLPGKKSLSEAQHYKATQVLIGGTGFLFIGLVYSAYLYFGSQGNLFLTKNRFFFIIIALLIILSLIYGWYGIKWKNKINDKIMHRISVNIFWGGIATLIFTIALILYWGGIPANPWG